MIDAKFSMNFLTVKQLLSSLVSVVDVKPVSYSEPFEKCPGSRNTRLVHK